MNKAEVTRKKEIEKAELKIIREKNLVQLMRNITGARIKADYHTQVSGAIALEITRACLNRYEKYTPPMNILTLLLMCKVYKCSIQDLLKDIEV